MKFPVPILTEGPLSGKVYVITHGKIEPHPTIDGETMITASVKYDVTDQFNTLVVKRTHEESERLYESLRSAEAEIERYRQALEMIQIEMCPAEWSLRGLTRH